MSALLHGLNFQLAAVLMSLGVFSYVEHHVRLQLASIFDACVLATDCRHDEERSQCTHRHRWNDWGVVAFNGAASVMTLLNLAYLGVMFAGSSVESDGDTLQELGYSWGHTMSVWSRLNFANHGVMLALWAISRIV